jgi:hypothetical protein
MEVPSKEGDHACKKNNGLLCNYKQRDSSYFVKNIHSLISATLALLPLSVFFSLYFNWKIFFPIYIYVSLQSTPHTNSYHPAKQLLAHLSVVLQFCICLDNQLLQVLQNWNHSLLLKTKTKNKADSRDSTATYSSNTQTSSYFLPSQYS